MRIKEWLILLLSLGSGMEPTHACDCWKKMYIKKKESLEVRTCTFEKKAHLTKSSWKMPKYLMLVSHANSLWFLSNQRVALLYKFFHDQPMSTSFSGIDRPLTSLYQESFTWSHTKVWQFIAILQWGTQSIPKPYVFLLRRIIKVLKKERGRTLGFQLIV